MATKFPAANDDNATLPTHTATEAPLFHLDDHNNAADAIKAIETKIGTGPSNQSPVLNKILIGTGSGTSDWSKGVPVGDIVGTSDAQTLSLKTLTAPTINNAIVNSSTISNPILTIDTINEFTANNGVSIDGLAIKDGAIVTANSIPSGALKDNSVGATNIAPTTILLGSTSKITTFGTTSSSAVQITGLTRGVNLPGNRNVEIEFFARSLYCTSTSYCTITIWDGAVGTGTLLATGQIYVVGATAQGPIFVKYTSDTPPSAGAKTYNMALATTAGTATLDFGVGFPGYISVKAI